MNRLENMGCCPPAEPISPVPTDKSEANERLSQLEKVLADAVEHGPPLPR